MFSKYRGVRWYSCRCTHIALFFRTPNSSSKSWQKFFLLLCSGPPAACHPLQHSQSHCCLLKKFFFLIENFKNLQKGNNELLCSCHLISAIINSWFILNSVPSSTHTHLPDFLKQILSFQSISLKDKDSFFFFF